MVPQLAALPIERQVVVAAENGFGAVYIDRRAFNDGGPRPSRSFASAWAPLLPSIETANRDLQDGAHGAEARPVIRAQRRKLAAREKDGHADQHLREVEPVSTPPHPGSDVHEVPLRWKLQERIKLPARPSEARSANR